MSGSSTNASASASICCVDRIGLSVFGVEIVATRSVPACVHGCLSPESVVSARVHALSASAHAVATVKARSGGR